MLFLNFNSPWIISRRKVIFSILIDASLYFIFFLGNIFKEEIFSFNLLLSKSIILILWIFISYVLGRYNFASNYQINKPKFSFLITFLSFLFFYFSIKLISIKFSFFYLLNNFFLRFIFLIVINSYLVNLFIIYFRKKK